MTNNLPSRIPRRQAPWQVTTWFAVAMFIAVGLPGSALADPEEGKEHKEDSRHQYVNLGVLGDQFIHCLAPFSTLHSLTGVEVGNFPGVEDYPCLGGAVADYAPTDGRDSWDVWIHDYAWNGCDAHTGPAQDGLCMVQPEVGWGVEGATEVFMEIMTGQDWSVELKSGGLARTVTMYDRPALTGNDADDCAPIPPNTDPTNGPNVCLEEVGEQSALRIANTFGFCGQGSIDTASGMVDPFDVSTGPDGGSATNIVVTKQVFTDGPLFYQLDCPMIDGITMTLKPFYDIAADIGNSVTCPVPIVNHYVACLFDLSSAGSRCYTDKFNDNVLTGNKLNLGVMAVVGEIGWTHELTDTCKDEPVHDDWVLKGPGTNTVFKGVPPEVCASAVYMDSKGTQPVIQCPLGDCAVGFHYWNRRIVNCFVEDGCTGTEVATRAALLSSVQRDFATADVLCNGASVFPASNDGPNDNAWAENTGQAWPGGHPIADASGNVPTPGNGLYECRMTYEHDDWESDQPYVAVAACDFSQLPHRPEAGPGSGSEQDSWWYDSPRGYCPQFRSQSTQDQLCPYAEAASVALDPVIGLAGGLTYGVAQVDEDANGMGDAWTAYWEAQIEEALVPIVDSDLDGLLNVDEFRWELVPKCVGLFTNCVDYDGDAWTDGLEVEYWNDENNDFLSAPSLAFLDPDRNIDSNGNGVRNVYDWDSDSDGLADGDEVQVYGTYPEFADSDCDASAIACTSSTDSGNYWDLDRAGNPGKGDGINDGDEIAAWDALGAGLRSIDHDGDGIPNLLDPDSDGDTLLDGEEFTLWNTKPHHFDSDLDGLRDDAEVRTHHTDPNAWDSDNDGMPDGWEVDRNLNPLVDDAALDPDADALSNLGEYTYARPGGWDEETQGAWSGGTNPSDPDTEGDALFDGEEVLTHGTDPFHWDTDLDGMADFFEVTYGFDPLSISDAALDADLDSFDQGNDGSIQMPWPNVEEYRYGRAAWDEVSLGPWRAGTDPLNPDTDGDGSGDGMEAYFGTNARVPADVLADEDGDGLTWADEANLGTNPSDPDTDGDGLCDGSRGPNCRFPGMGSTGNMPGEADYGSITWETDSDSDGRSDSWEAQKWDSNATGQALDVDGDQLNGVIDSDSDNDGLTDGDEFTRTTDMALPDTDADGLTDGDEVRYYLTNPKQNDHDNDGLLDGEEVTVHHTRPTAWDTDADGLSDGAEVNTHGTDPLLRDTDQDTLPDYWEVTKGTQARVADADQDPDADGLSNAREYAIGSKPMAADSEGSSGDGLPDGYEDQYGLGVLTYNPGSDADGDGYTNINEYNAKTHPRVADTDGDGRSDGWEALTAGTDPLDPDTDKDGLGDGAEYDSWVAKGYAWNVDHDSDTLKALRDVDSDNDGLSDRDELVDSQTMPHDSDSDNDGLSDFDEVVGFGGRFDPNDPDTDDDGQNDGVEASLLDPDGDTDNDGLKNGEEATYGTDPTKEDTDCDGAWDRAELTYWQGAWNAGGNRLLNPDVDGDSIKDGVEIGTAGTPSQGLYKTRPDVADTDGDGLRDDVEARNNVDTCPQGGGSMQMSASPLPTSVPTSSMPSLLAGLTKTVEGFYVGQDEYGWYVQGGYGVRLYVNASLASTATIQEVVDALGVQQRSSAGGPAVGTNGQLTDPTLPDTDGDGLSDGQERSGSQNPYGNAPTDPIDCDSDDDGLGDGLEVGIDSEGILKPLPLTADVCKQRDAEPGSKTNPNSLDTDGDDLSDGIEDADQDGKVSLSYDSNTGVYKQTSDLKKGVETSPVDADTDDDGILDTDEILAGLNPLDWDFDHDGLSDGLETGVTGPVIINNVLHTIQGKNVFGLADWPTYQEFPTPAEAPSSYGAGTAPLLTLVNNPDMDGDGLLDGLEDLNHNGRWGSADTEANLLGLTEMNPRVADSDGDGLADGLELLVHGKYSFQDFIDKTGTSFGKLNFQDGDGLYRTNPRQLSTDSGLFDNVPDGLDIMPKGDGLLRIGLHTFYQEDKIDVAWNDDPDGYKTDLVASVTLETGVGSYMATTLMMENFGRKNKFVSITDIDLDQAGGATQNPSTLNLALKAIKIADDAANTIEFDLSDNVLDFDSLPRDQIIVRINARDDDRYDQFPSDPDTLDISATASKEYVSAAFSLKGGNLEGGWKSEWLAAIGTGDGSGGCGKFPGGCKEIDEDDAWLYASFAQNLIPYFVKNALDLQALGNGKTLMPDNGQLCFGGTNYGGHPCT